MLSHHMVIRDGKIANYQPYPPTPWNASPRDTYGTPGPYEDAVQNTPIFEENGPENFKGIDIMRAVRSFDPCLPCGVHMYIGKGRVKKVVHTPDRARLRRSPSADGGSSDRVQELDRAALERDRRPRGACPAEELVGAMLELYGEGLARIVEALDERQPASVRDAGRRRRRREPAADPRAATRCRSRSG